MAAKAQAVFVDGPAVLEKEIRGTDRITRMGANYYMGCRCGNFKVTAVEAEVTKFRSEHLDNCKEEDA